MALGILESIQEQGLVGDLLKMGHNSAEYLHALVEALRLTLCASLHAVRLIPKPKNRLRR
jgi:gamma-glutamyltranspeptidase/glutathione hydrolase